MRNETILKIGHLAKAIAHAKPIDFAKWSVLVKNFKCQKHAKKHAKRTLEMFSAKKTARKNTKYSRNAKSLKIGHLAKAIAHAKAIDFAKWSFWVKNLKCQKHAKNHSTRTLEVFCGKKTLEKTPNIPEMREV